MLAYIIRRILLAIPTLFLVSMISFGMVRLIPGDAVDTLTAEMAEYGGLNQLDRATIERSLGLDVPIHVQYGRWLGVLHNADSRFDGVLQGNLGKSFWQKRTLVQDIALRWPVTFELGLIGLIIAQLIALPIGIYSAIRQNTWGDYIGRSFAILCIAVPGFWLGTLVIVFPAIWWGYMPPIMYTSFLEDPLNNIKMVIIPAIVLGMSMAGLTMRMTRTMMLEVIRQDYIRTAWAKGLRENVINLQHALRNALIPIVTIVGLQIPVLLGGTVIIEKIFVLPGMGTLIVEATRLRDYLMLSGIVLFYGAGLVLINLSIDLIYAFLNPKIRYE